ncbi:DNA double-strand break repair nuclease NurA [Nodosilinea sp. LEGE 07088]|uniref:DNA double-strand break repair nuclease NurA n=1 Tax=Nodosilinea sp. LEGE 07088 TaxID=2777968 RepID=UPI00187E13AA|nr:DNA double-strand break repair nuclease NurA [Nodosilinea sp. LEGE 07088]MBE9139279.1 DNA double-strand break repair nuclease NurA [Nodosilinea sp. LEGE 07088]
MLDLMKLARQMQGISQHLSQEAAAAQERVTVARRLLANAAIHQAHLVGQAETWGDRAPFTAAQPVEPLTQHPPIAAAPEAHTVIATDGSQISPSHHEIAYCYLINVGRVVLHYGQGRFPLLDSLPEVVYRAEDLYLSRQWGISTEEWMGHRRTVAEAVMLAELGATVHNSVVTAPASPDPAPVLALVDGSLIYWFLEALPAEARDRILPPILAAWEQLRQLGIPLVGYLSASRSGEAMNFLRWAACPFPQPDCQTHCTSPEGNLGDGQSPASKGERAPCGRFLPLRDATFWAMELAPGERSPFWRSTASILDSYGDHRVYFCYLHVGPEVARVEMPQWVMADEALRDRALSMVLTQVQKGYGYPVTLAEAHNQAVVRGGDRTRFFALLEQEMIRAGLKHVGTSYKEARKRGSIA